MMRPRLTIFDEPLLYTEGLSKLLEQSGIFTTIDICNCPEALKILLILYLDTNYFSYDEKVTHN